MWPRTTVLTSLFIRINRFIPPHPPAPRRYSLRRVCVYTSCRRRWRTQHKRDRERAKIPPSPSLEMERFIFKCFIHPMHVKLFWREIMSASSLAFPKRGFHRMNRIQLSKVLKCLTDHFVLSVRPREQGSEVDVQHNKRSWKFYDEIAVDRGPNLSSSCVHIMPHLSTDPPKKICLFQQSEEGIIYRCWLLIPELGEIKLFSIFRKFPDFPRISGSAKSRETRISIIFTQTIQLTTEIPSLFSMASLPSRD